MFRAKLTEEVKLLDAKEAEMLRRDKLAKSKQIETGLYLLCESPDSYTAFDYCDRQLYLNEFGTPAVKGWEKHFHNPLKAIDWLYETKR
ncbi:MAG: hypothetical protein IJT58_00565 [Synergistaceae bacterium]|nr:hypothetical protein [Synergistaceae bacterium]